MNQSNFDQASGCFSGKNFVMMYDGSTKLVSDIEANDKIMPYSGNYPHIKEYHKYYEIDTVVKFKCVDGKASFINYNKCVITPTHPILISNENDNNTDNKSTNNDFGLDTNNDFGLDTNNDFGLDTNNDFGLDTNNDFSLDMNSTTLNFQSRFFFGLNDGDLVSADSPEKEDTNSVNGHLLQKDDTDDSSDNNDSTDDNLNDHNNDSIGGIEMDNSSNGANKFEEYEYNTDQWRRPCDLSDNIFIEDCDYVYNFILKQGHIININGINCATLGHDFIDSECIVHDYFGTSKIIDDIKKCDIHKYGYVVFDSNPFLRKIGSTSWVCGIDLTKYFDVK
jgi:hypothetical protein